MKNDIYFAALAAWLTGSMEQVVAFVSSSEWDWDRFVNLASTSEVLSALFSPSIIAQLNSQIPENILLLLSTAQEMNLHRNQTALDQAAELARTLNAVTIEPLALKGLANLLTGVYPNGGDRYMADLDILVRAQDIMTSVSALAGLGYVAEEVHPVEFSIGHSYPVLFRPGSFEVDLHKTAGLGAVESFLPVSDLLAESLSCRMCDSTLRLPSPNHLVIHHILHSQLHDVYRARVMPSLRTLYDFYLLSRKFNRELDWDSISKEFRSRGQYESFALYLLQVQHYLGVQPPVKLQLTNLTRLRHRRRILLRRFPVLRLLDPSYYLLAGIKQRTIRLRGILTHPQGMSFLIRKLATRRFYLRLLGDFNITRNPLP